MSAQITKHEAFPGSVNSTSGVGFNAYSLVDPFPMLAWLTLQTNKCVKIPNCKELLRAQFTLANPVVWLYEQWLLLYMQTHTHKQHFWRLMWDPRGYESKEGVT